MKRFRFSPLVIGALIGAVVGLISMLLLADSVVKFECVSKPKFGSCPQIVWTGEVGRPCDKEIVVVTFTKDEKQQPIFYAICPQHHGSIWPVKVEPGPPVITPKR